MAGPSRSISTGPAPAISSGTIPRRTRSRGSACAALTPARPSSRWSTFPSPCATSIERCPHCPTAPPSPSCCSLSPTGAPSSSASSRCRATPMARCAAMSSPPISSPATSSVLLSPCSASRNSSRSPRSGCAAPSCRARRSPPTSPRGGRATGSTRCARRSTTPRNEGKPMDRSLHDRLTAIDGLQYSNWDRALFEELKAGGLSAVHATLAYWEDTRATLRLIGDWHRRFERHGDLILQGRSADDVVAAKASGRIAIFFGFQNCSPIEEDLGLVQIFHELGVRFMQLTYNNQSVLGGGCYEKEDSGLTRFGREVIAEMNRVGMVVDLSHSGERTTLEAIAASTRPVVISHANPTFLHENVRNKSGRVLRALAESGGMLGFSLYP